MSRCGLHGLPLAVQLAPPLETQLPPPLPPPLLDVTLAIVNSRRLLSPPCNVLQAAAGLLFITAALSLASVYFTARAVAELRQKQREVRYQEMGVVGDVLQFEPDV